MTGKPEVNCREQALATHDQERSGPDSGRITGNPETDPTPSFRLNRLCCELKS